MFRHGVARELVDASTVTALECLRPLRKGEARESEKQRPADPDDVARTMIELCPVNRAMVRIQLGTGRRPTELFGMRPRDIDQSQRLPMLVEVRSGSTLRRRTTPVSTTPVSTTPVGSALLSDRQKLAVVRDKLGIERVTAILGHTTTSM